MTKQCIICGKDFKMYQRTGYNYIGKTCSRECFFKSRIKTNIIECIVCKKSFDLKPYMMKGRVSGVYCCSRECLYKNKKENPAMYGRKTLSQEESLLVVKQYVNDMKRINDLAKDYSVSKQTIKNTLIKNEVQFRNKTDYITSVQSFTAIARRLIKERGNPCQNCKWDEANCDVHHILPRSKGGTNEKSNLIILCPNCHRLMHKNKLKI